MKFCIECGSFLISASVKFYQNCGFSLPYALGNPSDTPLENEVQNSKNNTRQLEDLQLIETKSSPFVFLN